MNGYTRKTSGIKLQVPPPRPIFTAPSIMYLLEGIQRNFVYVRGCFRTQQNVFNGISESLTNRERDRDRIWQIYSWAEGMLSCIYYLLYRRTQGFRDLLGLRYVMANQLSKIVVADRKSYTTFPVCDCILLGNQKSKQPT